MRIILDDKNYFISGSLLEKVECKYGSCQEYTGKIPEGFESYEDWFINCECKNAYKLIDDDLVLDTNKQNELQELYRIQAEENATATHKWVRNQLGKESSIVIDELSTIVNDTKLVILENSGDYKIPEIIVSGEETTGEVKVLVSNKNLLKNEAVTTTKNGITFTINEDKSITLDGTSTGAIELVLGGTSNSTDMLFIIKENIDYIKSGLADNVSLSLYNFDGTNRTLINSGGNNIINLTEGVIVTQTTLNIASGVKFDEVTIYPQIEINNEVLEEGQTKEATDYVKHQENSITGTLNNNYITIENELSSYDPISVVMNDRSLDLSVTYFTGKTVQKTETSIEALEDSITTSVKEINENLGMVQDAIDTVKETMLTQTAEAFEMLFTQSGIEDTVNAVQEALNGNTENLNTISQYIHFEAGSITLGASDSQSKLIIQKDRISFMTGENESAYISQNQLYITDSTILRKLQVGRWITQEDEYGNLNDRWVGEI